MLKVWKKEIICAVGINLITGSIRYYVTDLAADAVAA
jgi:hypothetical protein